MTKARIGRHARRIEAHARRKWARGMKNYDAWADNVAAELGAAYGYDPERAIAAMRPVLDKAFLTGPRNVSMRPVALR